MAMKRMTVQIKAPHARTLRGGNAVVSLGLLALAIILGGMLLSPLTVARLDLTRDKLYTLSPASSRLSGSLEAPAEVTLYITKDLPASYNSLMRQVRGLLEEYRSSSRGRLTIREVDPATDPEAKKSVDRLGIPEVQFNTRTSDKISVQKGYIGLSLTYREKNDLALPVLQDISSFEYDFTSLLKRATQVDATPRSIRFLTGHDEAATDQTQAIRQALQQTGNVSDLDLETEKQVPVGTSLLVILGPTKEIPDEHRKAIDAYLMDGGKALILAETIGVSQQLQPTTNDVKLAELLKPYGITLGSSLVGDDQSNDILPFSNGYVQFLEPYPYLVRALGSNADRGSPITRGIDSVSLFWPTSVTVTPPENTTGGTLLSTTVDGGFLSDDQADLRPASVGGVVRASSRGQQSLAVALAGAFPSAYHPEKKSKDGRIVVIGDVDIARDDVLRRFQGDGLFLLNAVDWLVQDEDLIQIRSKSLDARSLDPLSDAARAQWKWGNLLAAPLVLLIAGIVTWRLRRRTPAEL